MIEGRCDARRQSDGFALIMVLWFLVLIAAISTYLIANARSETAIARNLRAAATAEALADAAIAEAIFNQTANAAAGRWQLDGEPHLISLPDGEVTIRLYDETQNVNPNHASEVLMAALFEAAGVERTLARSLGASIADWVDSDTAPRPLGAEAQQYFDAGRSYGPPNAATESIDELQLVLGMTPELLALVRPHLTIHTDTAQPTTNNTSLIVRRALALAARAPAKDAADAEIPNSAPVAAAVSAGAAAFTAGTPEATARPAHAGDEEIALLDITARAFNGGVFVRYAVLKLGTSHPKGYVVLDWRRGDLGE
jgi:general secretion pathway protein K